MQPLKVIWLNAFTAFLQIRCLYIHDSINCLHCLWFQVEQPCHQRPKELVYAQVGFRPPNVPNQASNAPIAPPSIDRVVYATVHSANCQ